MARYTGAYSRFTTRLKEVNVLYRLATKIEQDDAIKSSSEIRALCRGAIVLLSSHLEAYVKELGEVALDSLPAKRKLKKELPDQFFYYLSRDIIDQIKGSLKPDKIGGKMFSFIDRDITLWSRLGPFLKPVSSDKFNRGFSNPKFKKIKQYFNRFGYEKYERDLAALLKAAYQPIVNMVNHLVDTRNNIAHGDASLSKIPSEIKNMMRLIQSFCRSTDSVFATWWKERHCGIR